jgi:hypothetical protein
VQQQLRNYERLRALVDEWIGLGLAAAKLERQRDDPVKSAAQTRAFALKPLLRLRVLF